MVQLGDFRMKRVMLLLLAALSSPALAESSRAELVEQSRSLWVNVFSSWQGCLYDAADRYSGISETADTVAVAAFERCAEWDRPARMVEVQLRGLELYQMPLGAAVESANRNADSIWSATRDRMRERVIAYVVEQRSRRRVDR
jgi:hypothetical protein